MQYVSQLQCKRLVATIERAIFSVNAMEGLGTDVPLFNRVEYLKSVEKMSALQTE
jgi:hypothetical protein